MFLATIVRHRDSNVCFVLRIEASHAEFKSLSVRMHAGSFPFKSARMRRRDTAKMLREGRGFRNFVKKNWTKQKRLPTLLKHVAPKVELDVAVIAKNKTRKLLDWFYQCSTSTQFRDLSKDADVMKVDNKG